MEEIIRAEEVSYKYDEGKKALERINLEIEEGEYVAIIGSNGSGKSTLAKLFNALLLPTEGRILIDGEDTREEEELWKIRAKVGMVFQNPDNQIVAALVEDDVAFGAENLGVEAEEIRRRVEYALKAVRMEEFRKAAPHKLSGGQKQRIAIAGALALQTKCIVFDEATAMLDPEGREEVLGVINKIHKERGITVIYITHFMEEAALADRIIVMNSGRIVDIGTPKKIFAQAGKLKELGLEVPTAVELGRRLKGIIDIC